VHQAKSLKDLHKGGHDPEVLRELRAATDLVLHAMKITTGHAMSMMVVQEEANKLWFMNAPMSQSGLFGNVVVQQFSAAQKQTEAIKHILPQRAAAAPPTHRPGLGALAPQPSKLSSMQRISFLCMELDSIKQTAHLMEEHAQSVLDYLNMIKSRTA
ncbi:hypothetical protein M9458_015239, partial [Cirrhinus mrigala]